MNVLMRDNDSYVLEKIKKSTKVKSNHFQEMKSSGEINIHFQRMKSTGNFPKT